MELSEVIAEQIRQNGPIPFREFMECCLYDSRNGYYTSSCDAIGPRGDFYTSATLSPVFGAIMAKQLEEMWSLMGRHPFTILEYGAGTGHLCRDILDNLQTNSEMYTDLRYCIIEKSPLMRSIAKRLLHDKVEWYDSISDISVENGCILSNELVDNFAVHRVIMENELMEIFVDYQNGFSEVLRPAGPELKEYLSELGINLPKGFTAEINLEAVNWITGIASRLKRGYVLTVDYGYSTADMYQPCRSRGTLLCYYKHSVNDSLYQNIGKQDITSFVNFSALSRWGEKNGLREVALTNQQYFLTSLGFHEKLLDTLSHEKDIVMAAQKAVQITHTLLIGMGCKYKVLIQEKGVGQHRLSGLINIPV